MAVTEQHCTILFNSDRVQSLQQVRWYVYVSPSLLRAAMATCGLGRSSLFAVKSAQQHSRTSKRRLLLYSFEEIKDHTEQIDRYLAAC